ncbi:GntR family transcriptional regulator, partial [Klebsiella pneumoniae]
MTDSVAPFPLSSAARAAGLPRYRQIAGLYVQAIAAGSLQPGMRLPSVRELCQRHGVSLTTALQVLRHLEAEGFAQARERVGYF